MITRKMGSHEHVAVIASKKNNLHGDFYHVPELGVTELFKPYIGLDIRNKMELRRIKTLPIKNKYTILT